MTLSVLLIREYNVPRRRSLHTALALVSRNRHISTIRRRSDHIWSVVGRRPGGATCSTGSASAGRVSVWSQDALSTFTAHDVTVAAREAPTWPWRHLWLSSPAATIARHHRAFRKDVCISVSINVYEPPIASRLKHFNFFVVQNTKAKHAVWSSLLRIWILT